MALDRAAFGHDRSALMRLLRERANSLSFAKKAMSRLSRPSAPFGRGLVIGPVVARNDTEAKALIDFLLAHHQGTFVRVDTDVSTDLAEWLTGRGLTHVGGGITMRRATAAHEDKQARASPTYALVSQALG